MTKRAWRYDPDAPRCGNCQNFQRPRVVLRESELVRQFARCRPGGFAVVKNGCCDRWVGRDGTKLEK